MPTCLRAQLHGSLRLGLLCYCWLVYLRNTSVDEKP